MRSVSIRNHLLASLPHDALELLSPKLTQVTLESRKQLYVPESTVDAVYFVESGMISLVTTFEDGVQVEVGTVGREGMLGISLAFGNTTAFFEAMVQIPGTALRMGASDFKSTVEASEPLRNLLRRYSEGLRLQAMQTAACNVHHRLELRLARWLLMAHDQVDGNEVPLTQELLAMMLGAHRPSVTVASHSLYRSGLIKQSMGRVIILDRSGLESAACECYGLTCRRWNTLLGSAKV